MAIGALHELEVLDKKLTCSRAKPAVASGTDGGDFSASSLLSRATSAPTHVAQAHAAPLPSSVVVLDRMLTHEDLVDDRAYSEVTEDVTMVR